MSNLELPGVTKTLRQRLNEGRIPAQDGLRYAAQLAESLRAIHETACAHGSVTPEAIVLTPDGLNLLPSSGVTRITPYTAPEIAGDHKPADARSDIFSFGSVLFEMLTGRKAFEGDTEAALAAAICAAPAPPSGNPAVDRLLTGCLAKDPAGRWQHVQKIQLELKLLMASARRGVSSPAPRLTAPVAAAFADATSRIEMAQLEARVNARLAVQENQIAQMQIAVNEAVNSMRTHLNTLALRMNTAQSFMGLGADAMHASEAAASRLAAELRADLQENIDQLSRRVAYVEQSGVGSGAPPEEFARLDSTVERIRRDLRELHQDLAADFHDFEIALEQQSGAIESARTAMAQTDDLVERVVEALESLQSSFLQPAEDHMVGAA